VTGVLYLQALAAGARATSATVQRQTGEALYNQAVDLKSNGLIAGLDVLRAQVELNAQTQRALAATNDAEKARLQLARVIGLPLGQPFALDANLPALPAPTITLAEALERAFGGRPDYLAALERVKAAEAEKKAVEGDRLPSLNVNADFGAIGLTPRDARGTFAIVGAMSMPLFDGGRIQGRLLEAEATLRNRRAEAEDLRAQIYYDIRMAFLDLQATTARREDALKGRELAVQQLTQSRDRFAAGVTSNVEVVQAQEAVAVAEEQYIAAEYGYGLAKGALLRGVGTAEDVILQLLGGAR
jgi:outer membrane protein TolC